LLDFSFIPCACELDYARSGKSASPSTLPGISSKPSQLAEVIRAAREAGACGVWANLLFLRPGTREHFMAALGEDFPEQLDYY
jgi:hypothetical protein